MRSLDSYQGRKYSITVDPNRQECSINHRRSEWGNIIPIRVYRDVVGNRSMSTMSKNGLDRIARRLFRLGEEGFEEDLWEPQTEDIGEIYFGMNRFLENSIAQAVIKLEGRLSWDNMEQVNAMRFIKSQEVQDYLQLLEDKLNNGHSYPPEFWHNYFLEVVGENHI